MAQLKTCNMNVKKELQSKGRKIGAISGAVAAITPAVYMDITDEIGPAHTILLGPSFAMGGAAIGAALGHIGGKVVNKIETNKNNKQIAQNAIDKLQKQLEAERKKQQNRRYPMDEKPNRDQPWDEKPVKVPQGRI